MADTFGDRKVRAANGQVVQVEKITFDGTAATWTMQGSRKIIFVGYELVSGTGDGTVSWSGATATFAGFTNADVILAGALCNSGTVGVTLTTI
ncbi:MAG: hypothetical protein WC551_10625 [Patescibacteria group bacterium]